MSEVWFIAEWTLIVLGIWTLASICAAIVWCGMVELFTWRSQRRASLYGRDWGDL